MASTRGNDIDQQLDVSGSLNPVQNLVLVDEATGLGAVLQTGAGATVTAPSTLTGLSGMTVNSVGNYITLTGTNAGTYLIDSYISAASVTVAATLANDTGVGWSERQAYSLEDDLNYIRTDRQLIKGTTNWYDDIPEYITCGGVTQDANLTNIAGKTTDAKTLIVNRKFENVSIGVGDGYATLSSPGNLKHSEAAVITDGYDITGVPLYDGPDAGNDAGTYVELIDGYSAALHVLSGPNAGNRIFGRTRAGTTGVTPNSVEVEFRSVPDGDPISSSVAYSWEAGQTTTVDVFYPYRECLDGMDENALRVTLVNGLVGDAGLRQNVVDLQTVIGVGDGDTDLAGQLTNLTLYYPFSNLPDVTPSVVEALNTLNEQIGPRDYDGYILTDGYTITQSLQQLSDAIESGTGAVNIIRTIERLGAQVNAGVAHTIPGGQTYVLDGTNNGRYMWLYWRGVLRDPGSAANDDDYSETSTTSFTPFSKIKANDHINYFIVGT